jgi:hypothetical protein
MAKYGIFNQPSVKEDGTIKNQAGTVNMACGDYYGTGHKNPIGRMRDDSLGYRPVSKKQIGTPPKSVV